MAVEKRTPVAVVGGQTKKFFGRVSTGTPLDVSRHRGVVNYEPTELVITARAGTPLTQIEQLLASQNQTLGFEPPHYGPTATLGGTIACGLSGPRRPYAGAARDFVLGTKIINGRAEILHFGGEVMKNVAGYDISRLMVGALGTLGLLLEISLKVLPQPQRESTLAFALAASEALARMSAWAGEPLPVSAACYAGGILYIRLSGSEAAVRSARATLGGDEIVNTELWHDLREHQLGFFQGEIPLWRLSVPPAAPLPPLSGAWLLDWGGAQRWLKTAAPAQQVRDAAETVGGHATLFRGGDRAGEVFHPLATALAQLQRNLKRAFDPAGILNPGRITAVW